MAKQVKQQVELPGSKDNFLQTTPCAAGLDVQLQVSNLFVERLFRTSAAQQGSEAGKQFGKSEWFHQVIIGARIKTQHPVFNRIASHKQ